MMWQGPEESPTRPVSSSQQIQSQSTPAKNRYISGEYFPGVFIKGISANSGFLGILKYDHQFFASVTVK